MKLKTIIAIAIVACCGWTPANAGTTDIYLSFSGFGDGGALGNNVQELGVGNSGTAYIWVNDNYNIDTGAFLDVLNDNTGVIAFTDARVNQYNILVGVTPVNTRWQDSAINGGTVTPGLVDEMRGFRVDMGTGILTSQATGQSAFLDAGHDPTSSAFLFAEVDYSVVGLGSANISLGIGDGLIVDNGIELFPNFGGAIVTGVVPDVVPEPTTAGLLALGLVGLVSRRRRS